MDILLLLLMTLCTILLGFFGLGILYVVIFDNENLDNDKIFSSFILGVIFLVLGYVNITHTIPDILDRIQNPTEVVEQQSQPIKQTPEIKVKTYEEGLELGKKAGYNTGYNQGRREGIKDGSMKAYREILGIDSTINLK